MNVEDLIYNSRGDKNEEKSKLMVNLCGEHEGTIKQL
jgi:hypothetical protein